jgi:methionyl-tRNA formyltransferase
MPPFIFFGTDEFAVKVLDELAAREWLPTVIITTPDQPAGRKLLLTPPPVKTWAEHRGITVLQPENLRDPELAQHLKSANFALFIVAAYGKIIPPTILELPASGTLNIHPSLLPHYRGPSPLQSAILQGDQETGVSIMKLDEQMDHGPILRQESLPLSAISFEELRDKLAKLGAELLIKTISEYVAGKLTPHEQEHANATYTKKFTKADAEIKLREAPELNYRKILALNPNPGTWFVDETGTRLKVLSAHLENDELKFDRVIPEGKKEMDWESYIRGQNKH